MPRLSLLALALLVVLAATPALAQTGGLSLDDVVALKELGYDDATVRKELERTGTKLRLTAEVEQALRKAGCGDALVAWLKARAPRVEVTLDQVLAWSGAGKAPAEIIAKLGTQSFKLAPADALELVRGGVHPAVIRAVKGGPLVKDDLLRLAGKRTSEAAFGALLKRLGAAWKPAPPEALELIKAGVPRSVVKALIGGAQPPKPGPTKPAAGEMSHFEHIGGGFGVASPPTWQVLRELDNGTVSWAFTPDDTIGKTLEDLDRAFVVQRLAIMPGNAFAFLELRALIDVVSGLARASEPGLAVEGEPEAVKLGALDGFRVRLAGAVKGRDGRYRGWIATTRRGRFVYLIAAQAPEADYAALEPTFEAMRAGVRLGRKQVSQRTKTWRTEELVEANKHAVVSVVAGYENKPVGSGSGFVVRADGYVVTNHHVVFDEDKKQFYTDFTIAWDDSLGRRPVKAKLVGAKREYRGSLIKSLAEGGVDIALLKIVDGEAEYPTVKLTPLREVKLGDGVVAMGFPRRDVMTGLSLFVTKGGVVRFNRDDRGVVRSIYTDAKITHGNSGGPCFDVETGGVFGINTFGAWHGIEDASQRNRQLQLGDLVGYYGVIPVRDVFREFPQYTLFPAGWERKATARDRVLLAHDFLGQGLFSAAKREAEAALELQPGDPDALLVKAYAIGLGGDPRTMIDLLKKTSQRHPEHFETLVALASVHFELADYLEAANHVERAAALRKDDLQVTLLRGRIYLAIGRHDEALVQAKAAAQLTGDAVPDPAILAGQVHYAKGDLEAGRAAFQRAVEANRYEADAWLGLGEYFERQKKWDAAILEYGKLQRLLPHAPEAAVAIGRCYREARRYEKAVASYRIALARYHKAGQTPAAEMLYQYGWLCQHTLKNVDEAMAAYKLYLLHHGALRPAWRVHLEAALLLRDQKAPAGLCWAHMARGLALSPEEDELKKTAGTFQRAGVDARSLIVMAKLGYAPQVMLDLILHSSLALRITTKEQVQQLARAGVPVGVIAAILKLQERAGPAKREPTGGGQGPTLVGRWQNAQTVNGTPVVNVLEIAANGQFSESTFHGQTRQLLGRVVGSIQVVGQGVLQVTVTQPQAVQTRASFSLTADRFTIQFPNRPPTVYQRVR